MCSSCLDNAHELCFVSHAITTHATAIAKPAVIHPVVPNFQPPEVALLDEDVVPDAVEPEDAVDVGVLRTVSV